MKLSVFGLGYVGCVSLGCFARSGHSVIGVDVEKHKIDLINNGKPTIIEEGICELIKDGKRRELISATHDYIKAVCDSDISIICVGTPSSKNGHLDLNYIIKVSEEIAEGIKAKRTFHLVVIRSTVTPGTNRKIGSLIEKLSHKMLNTDFAVVSNPEFLREGNAVSDFYNPAVTVLGLENEKALNMMQELYKDVKAPIEVTDIEAAEIIKYINNSFHALKITFSNEVGNICKKLGINSYRVMELFCRDTKLNISDAYLKPGPPYGGSCLPKDLRGLQTLAHDNYLSTPLIDSIEMSNTVQKKTIMEMIESKRIKRIGIFGLSFKAGTDDLRFSPSVQIAEYFLGKGYEIWIYDKNVSVSNLTGTNKLYIDNHIPHLAKMLSVHIEDFLLDAELIVFTQNAFEFLPFIEMLREKHIIDLVKNEEFGSLAKYEGICW